MRTHVVAFAAAIMLLLVAAPVAAVTKGGVPDAGEHPQVGQLVFYVPDAPTSPIAPRRTRLANPSPTPLMIAVPQSGPITSRPFDCAIFFNSISSASETLSL